MNTDKAKRLLRKAQALFDNLSDQGSVSNLERDLLLSYIRELYEEISAPQSANQPKQEAVAEPPARKTVVEEPKDDFPEPPKVTPRPIPVWEDEPVHKVPEAVNTRIEQIIQKPKQEYVETIAEVNEKKLPVTEQKSHNTAVESESNAALLSLFEFKAIGELSEKLKFQPIDRIEHGMGINERILSVNELFNGDNELFKKTLDELNGMANFKEAQGYLMEGVASKFNWAEEGRKNKATYFIHLVRRRYAQVN